MIKALEPIQKVVGHKRAIDGAQEKGEREKETSGFESEPVGMEAGEPPQKVQISELDDGSTQQVISKSPKHKTEFAHKTRSPKSNPAIFRGVAGPNKKGIFLNLKIKIFNYINMFNLNCDFNLLFLYFLISTGLYHNDAFVFRRKWHRLQ